MDKRAVVHLNLLERQEQMDIDVPLDINAGELLEALNDAYSLGLSIDESGNVYVKAENPVVLMHGRKTLGQYGIMNGSTINLNV